MADDPGDIDARFHAAVRQMLALGPPLRLERQTRESVAQSAELGERQSEAAANCGARPVHLRLLSDNLKTAFPVQDSGSFASLLARLDRS
jgi:hypothetical protein